LSLDDAFLHDSDLASLLECAARIYQSQVSALAARLAIISEMRRNHVKVPARLVWDVGQDMFTLEERLSAIGLQVDGMYEHLTRDLDVKRKWLEKAVILRRYVPERDSIPAKLNWGRCEKGTRRVAVLIVQGLLKE